MKRQARLSLRPKILHLNKIKVAAVSYLNTKPLLYGIRKHPVFHEIELIEDYPARIAQLLINNEADLGLIPVAAIKKLPEWHIISDYCIGTQGEVASVCIFSDVPMEAVETVFLDYQSRTSVNLAKVLLREFWKKEVRLVDASGEDYRQHIRGTAAGVVIGDRALEQRTRSKYIYDLGTAWKQHTGLPFVFAAWIANKALPPTFISQFNEANALGLTELDQVIRENNNHLYDLERYFRHNLDYRFDEAKKTALHEFLRRI